MFSYFSHCCAHTRMRDTHVLRSILVLPMLYRYPYDVRARVRLTVRNTAVVVLYSSTRVRMCLSSSVHTACTASTRHVSNHVHVISVGGKKALSDPTNSCGRPSTEVVLAQALLASDWLRCACAQDTLNAAPAAATAAASSDV